MTQISIILMLKTICQIVDIIDNTKVRIRIVKDENDTYKIECDWCMGGLIMNYDVK